jgi:hypothetical protein
MVTRIIVVLLLSLVHSSFGLAQAQIDDVELSADFLKAASSDNRISPKDG